MSTNYSIYGAITLMAVVIIFIGAWFEGINTGRFSDPHSKELDSMIHGIRNIPIWVGDWEGDTDTERTKLNEDIAKESGAKESLGRTYRSSRNVKPVSINIICGLSRKVGIHTPDACYRGAGYTIEGNIQTVVFNYMPKSPLGLPIQMPENDDPKSGEGPQPLQPLRAEFKTALFVRPTQDGGTERQRVYWTWKGIDSGWISPESPRIRWKATDPLAKLYLSTIETGDPSEESPVQEFANAFLPELDILLSGNYVPPEGSLEKIQKPETPAAKPGETSPKAPAAVKPIEGRLPDLQQDADDLLVNPIIDSELPNVLEI